MLFNTNLNFKNAAIEHHTTLSKYRTSIGLGVTEHPLRMVSACGKAWINSVFMVWMIINSLRKYQMQSTRFVVHHDRMRRQSVCTKKGNALLICGKLPTYFTESAKCWGTADERIRKAPVGIPLRISSARLRDTFPTNQFALFCNWEAIAELCLLATVLVFLPSSSRLGGTGKGLVGVVSESLWVQATIAS